MQQIWHARMAVPDLDTGMAEIGELLGLAWRPVVTRPMTITDENGHPHPVDCHVTFSLGGPFAIEVWQAIPGTPLAVPESGYLHHLGYWVEDYAAEKERLAALGYPPFLSSQPSLLISGARATSCSNHVTCGAISPTCAICTRRTPPSPASPYCPPERASRTWIRRSSTPSRRMCRSSTPVTTCRCSATAPSTNSTAAPSRAGGSSPSSGTWWSRRSTPSPQRACAHWVGRPARLAGSPCQWPATTLPPRLCGERSRGSRATR